MKKLFQLTGVFALICGFIANSYAITWFPEEFTCPVDNEKNTFMVVGSYGSYIYSYPSKYQWLFFPVTDSPTFYMCKKSHFSAYMWDFDKIPKDKIPEIKKLLVDVKISKPFKDEQYMQIPVSERLEVMEIVYSVLDKDKEWWEEFYRIKGYHYGKENKPEKAAQARKKSLEMIQAELKNDKSKSPKKLLLYVSAALKHFLNDDKGAAEDFDLALKTKYEDSSADAENVKNAEDGLNATIKDYLERIKSDKKPRMFDGSIDDDDH